MNQTKKKFISKLNNLLKYGIDDYGYIALNEQINEDWLEEWIEKFNEMNKHLNYFYDFDEDDDCYRIYKSTPDIIFPKIDDFDQPEEYIICDGCKKNNFIRNSKEHDEFWSSDGCKWYCGKCKDNYMEELTEE